jgi:hypothetical protein
MVELLEAFIRAVGAFLLAIGNAIIYIAFEIIPYVFKLMQRQIAKCPNKAVRVVLTIIAAPVSFAVSLAIPTALVIGVIFTVDYVGSANRGIESITFNSSEEIHFNMDDTDRGNFFSSFFSSGSGELYERGYVLIEFKGNARQRERARGDFVIEDIEFLIADSGIATIEIDDGTLVNRIFEILPVGSDAIRVDYRIIALSEGETTFSVQSANGRVSSVEVRIVVSEREDNS